MSFAAPQSFESTAQDKVLGLFFFIAIGLVIYLFYVSENKVGEQGTWMEFHTTISTSYGLEPGAKIFLSGVEIGRVEKVSLISSGEVKLNFLLSTQYQNFYTQGSSIKLKSDIGIDTVLSGAGIEFHTAGASKSLLANGDEIEMIEPKSINQLLEEWNVEQIAKQVSSIVSNLEKVVGTLGENQIQLTNTLTNASELSSSLINTTNKLPQLLDTVNSVALKADSLLGSLEGDYKGMNQQVGELMKTTQTLSHELTAVVKGIEPSLLKAPELIDNLNGTSLRVNLLMHKLNSHWLLGGERAPSPMAEADLGDSALYQPQQIHNK